MEEPVHIQTMMALAVSVAPGQHWEPVSDDCHPVLCAADPEPLPGLTLLPLLMTEPTYAI